MTSEDQLHLLDQFAVLLTNLLLDWRHDTLRVLPVVIANCLFELAMQAISFTQTAHIKGQQHIKIVCIVRKLPLHVVAGLKQLSSRSNQIPLGTALAFARPHRLLMALRDAPHPVDVIT